MVADFGIALAVSLAGGHRITETGLSLGTPQYMSPEQATADRELDGRTDIYSLGCVLYEMLAGETPHTGNTVQAIIAKVLADEPRRVRLARSTVPPYVEAVVHQALEKLPADRFATATQFAEALRQSKVMAVPGEEAVAPVPGRAVLTERRPSWWRAIALTAVGIAVLVTVAAIWGWVREMPAGPLARFVVSVGTGLRVADAYGTDIAISPDGSRIVFVGRSSRGEQLYVRALDVLEPHAIPGTEGAGMPFFAPDGAWVGFKAADGSLKKVQLDGGATITVAPAAQNWIGASWGANDLIVAGTSTSGLYAISPSGGAPERLTPFDQTRRESGHELPELLADGRRVIFSIRTSQGRRIGVASVSTGNVTLTDLVGSNPHYLPTGHLVYATADQSILAAPFDLARSASSGPSVPLLQGVAVAQEGAAELAVSQTGSMIYLRGSAAKRLVMVGTDGAAFPLLDDLHTYRNPRFSPDGTRLAFEIQDAPQIGIGVLRLRDRTLSRLAFGEASDIYPVWTPDGRRITFASTRAGHYQIYSLAADGSGSIERVFASAEPVPDAVWSTDGRMLVYRVGAPGDLWYRSLHGDTVSKRIVAGPAAERMPALSPDNRWLAYASNESGRDEVYVLPFPPGRGGRVQVSDNGGTQPVWAPSERALFYRQGDDFIRADVEAAPTFSVVGRKTLFAGGFAVGAGLHANYDVHPAGQGFVMVAPTVEAAELVVVLNWFAEVQRRVTAR